MDPESDWLISESRQTRANQGNFIYFAETSLRKQLILDDDQSRM